MEEVQAVAHAVGATPQGSIERRIAGAEAVGAHKTSMLHDFEAGKSLELDAIATAVIELADRTGVDVPHLRDLCAATDLLVQVTNHEGGSA